MSHLGQWRSFMKIKQYKSPKDIPSSKAQDKKPYEDMKKDWTTFKLFLEQNGYVKNPSLLPDLKSNQGWTELQKEFELFKKQKK